VAHGYPTTDRAAGDPAQGAPGCADRPAQEHRFALPTCDHLAIVDGQPDEKGGERGRSEGRHELHLLDAGRYTAGQSGGTRRKGTDQNVHLVAGEVSAVPVVSSRSRRAAGLSDIV
jgi:hypothetical protein